MKPAAPIGRRRTRRDLLSLPICPIGLYLYGRKMYETMAIWETPDVIPGLTSAMLIFARFWQAADKIVYSKSLEIVSTPKTRLERDKVTVVRSTGWVDDCSRLESTTCRWCPDFRQMEPAAGLVRTGWSVQGRRMISTLNDLRCF